MNQYYYPIKHWLNEYISKATDFFFTENDMKFFRDLDRANKFVTTSTKIMDLMRGVTRRIVILQHSIGGELTGWKLYQYRIDKLDDEWFYCEKFLVTWNKCEKQSVGYMCDQLEGLIEYLKDEGIEI